MAAESIESVTPSTTEKTPAQKSVSRFSWDRLLHEGQEKLASFIDIEGPEEHEIKAEEVPHSDSGSAKRASTESYDKIYKHGGTATSSSSSVISGSGSMQLEKDGTPVKPQDQRKFSAESSLDRMRRTIKRYSEQSKEPVVEASPLVNEDSKKRKKLKQKQKDAKPAISEHSVPAEAPTMMDKLMDLVVSSALPTASVNIKDADWRSEKLKGQPQFSINVMGNNFRRMTARTGIVFETIYTLLDILSWRNPFLSLSALSIYSYLVLNPRLIPIAPLLFISFRIMVPAYIYRHPPDPTWIKPSNPVIPPGPPLSDAMSPKPVPELSREFFYNVVDTQNFMVQYIDGFDLALDGLKKFAFFDADECTSSLVYTVLVLSSFAIYFTLPYVIRFVPWKFVFLVIGWVGAIFAHPKSQDKVINPLKTQLKSTQEKGKMTLNKVVSSTRRKPSNDVSATEIPEISVTLTSSSEDESSNDDDSDQNSEDLTTKSERFWKKVDTIAYHEFNYYEPHEQREVEMFEIQCTFKSKYEQKDVTSTNTEASTKEADEDTESTTSDPKQEVGHWEYSVFTNTPYLPVLRGSQIPSSYLAPLQGGASAPEGTVCTSLSKVLAPKEWQFVPGATWKLDMDAETWVSNRGVPVDTKTGTSFITVDNDEKWVYDKNALPTSTSTLENDAAIPSQPEQDDGRKVYLRRRRWSRICTRHVVKREA